jgi:hypothetical protein
MGLTDDDKRWFSELMGGLYHEREGRLDQRIERVEPRVEQFGDRICERLDRFETTLVTEFRNWATRMDAQQRTHSADLRAIELKLERLSDRVKKLEGGTTVQ